MGRMVAGTALVARPAGTALVARPAGTALVARPAGTALVARPAGTALVARQLGICSRPAGLAPAQRSQTGPRQTSQYQPINASYTDKCSFPPHKDTRSSRQTTTLLHSWMSTTARRHSLTSPPPGEKTLFGIRECLQRNRDLHC